MNPIGDLCVGKPMEDNNGLTVFRVHKSDIIDAMLLMQHAWYGSYCKIQLIESETLPKNEYVDLHYEMWHLT